MPTPAEPPPLSRSRGWLPAWRGGLNSGRTPPLSATWGTSPQMLPSSLYVLPKSPDLAAKRRTQTILPWRFLGWGASQGAGLRRGRWGHQG